MEFPVNVRRPIVVTGFSCSGKSTLARVLRERTGRRCLEMGDFARRDSSSCERCDTTVAHVRHVFAEGDCLRFAQAAVQECAGISGDFLIVGPRHVQEVLHLKARLGAFAVGLQVDVDTRRLRRRSGYPDEPLEWFAIRDSIEREWDVDATIGACDLILDGARPVGESAEIVLEKLG